MSDFSKELIEKLRRERGTTSTETAEERAAREASENKAYRVKLEAKRQAERDARTQYWAEAGSEFAQSQAEKEARQAEQQEREAQQAIFRTLTQCSTCSRCTESTWDATKKQPGRTVIAPYTKVKRTFQRLCPKCQHPLEWHD